MPAPTPYRPCTVEQLKADIDSGRTGDKVSLFDPAAVPLGADEEAAGTRLDPGVIAAAREQECAGVDWRPVPGGRFGATWLMLAIIVGMAAVFAASAPLLRQ